MMAIVARPVPLHRQLRDDMSKLTIFVMKGMGLSASASDAAGDPPQRENNCADDACDCQRCHVNISPVCLK